MFLKKVFTTFCRHDQSEVSTHFWKRLSLSDGQKVAKSLFKNAIYYKYDGYTILFLQRSWCLFHVTNPAPARSWCLFHVKSSPGTILVLVPPHKSCRGTCSTSQILPQVTIRNTVRGLIRINDNDPADIHRCNATVYHVTGSGATRSRSTPHTNQDKRANPHIDRFHIPIRINDPAHITIDSTFNLSI